MKVSKGKWFSLLSVGLMVISLSLLAACSGSDKDSCMDACKKLDGCGMLGVSVNECNTLCEDDGTQQDIDCVMDNSCGNIANRC